MTVSKGYRDQAKIPLDFSIGFQNIEGLHSDCECFLSEITENIKNDIHFLAETWSCDHAKEIDGYKHYFQNGFKTPGVITGRSSGGLLIYVKENVQKFVKILSFTPYKCWLEIDKCLFENLNQNLIISAQYSPPGNSNYHSQNSCENLKVDLLQFCDENTPIVLIGDFNARTGNIPDNLEIDPNFDPSYLEQSEFKNRNNLDKTVTTHGKNFIDTITSRNLRILNGRFSGDLLGNFTTYKNGHSSVNDYGVVSENLFNRVENFSVFPQTVFSDHAPIVVSIGNKAEIKTETFRDDKNWYNLDKRTKWDPQSLAKLGESLEKIEQKELDEICEKAKQNNVNQAAIDIMKIIENKTKLILGDVPSQQKSTKNVPYPHKRRKRKNKIWFDQELQKLKKITNKLSTKKHHAPENLDLKNQHRESLKMYRDQCNAKKQPFDKKNLTS